RFQSSFHRLYLLWRRTRLQIHSQGRCGYGWSAQSRWPDQQRWPTEYGSPAEHGPHAQPGWSDQPGWAAQPGWFAQYRFHTPGQWDMGKQPEAEGEPIHDSSV